MKRNFDTWLKTFESSIADWKYYTDFDKVNRNVQSIKRELNLLNSLIGSKNIDSEFRSLVKEYPKVLNVIPILIAKRGSEVKIVDVEGDFNFNFKNLNYSIDDYCIFMKNTGLFELLEEHIIRDLTDYVKGVEVGMDTNARKNRTGHTMENIVEGYIKKAEFVKDVNYFKEMTKSSVEAMFGLDLSAISNKGKTEIRFDFVVKGKTNIYVVETNFYGSAGSKLNETARSYQLLSQQSKDIKGLKFIWFTDGIGWKSAKNNLRQTFDVMDDIYNIKDMKNGIINKIIK